MIEFVDRPVGSLFVIPVVLITLAGVVLAAQSAAQLGFSFHGGPAIVFNPLQFSQSYTLYAGDTASLNYGTIMTLNIHKPSALLTFNSQAVNTTKIFQPLALTLFFNSTQVTLNGLQNTTSTLTLNKGYYVITGALAYTVLTSVNSTTGSWTVTITGT